jgi:formiminotetrahydrofolate cyclodeaminase
MATAEMTLSAFLGALAARESTPGGGGAAAVTGSQAAALLSMVINFTIGNKRYADVEAEMQQHLQTSETLRRELLALADADVEAFQAVAACYAMPKTTDAEKAERTAALQEALKGATQVPFHIAEVAYRVIELAGPVSARGNRNVVSDGATALYLAHAALHSAIVNVNINLKFIKDTRFVEEWSAKRDELLQRAEAVYQQNKTICEETLDIPL